MKKQWENPEISCLDITQTMGGPVDNPEADGDGVWDEEQKKWWYPHGTDGFSS